MVECYQICMLKTARDFPFCSPLDEVASGSLFADSAYSWNRRRCPLSGNSGGGAKVDYMEDPSTSSGGIGFADLYGNRFRIIF